jgi:PAS domain S-box-containing protein
MNRKLGELANVEYDNVQGKTDFEIFPKPTAQLFRSQDEEVIQRKTQIDFEETILLPEGVQSFITSKFPIIDHEGKVYAVGGICTDITERKRTEAKFREAEEKYRGIFEHSPLGILHLDNEGIVTACNEKLAKILGSSVIKIKGLDTLKYNNDEEIKTAIKTVLSGKIARYKGYYQSVTGGGRIYISAISSPIFSSNGSLTGAIVIIEDITERMEADAALRKAKGELEQRVTDRTAQLDLKNERLIETNSALKI